MVVMKGCRIGIGMALLWGGVLSLGQNQPARPGPAKPNLLGPQTQQGQQPANQTSFPGAVDRLRPGYTLRAGDQIMLRAFEMDEISNTPFRIDADGMINFPLLGRVRAGGLTVESLESLLVDLSRRYVRVPQITITVVGFSSEPIFFEGAFKSPGIYPLEGRRTLVEMISSIGGLQPNAARRIKVTRRKEIGEIPLPNAITAPDGSVSSVEVNMASLRDNLNPAEDIVLQPFDVVSVERAEMVYVTGEVTKVGALELDERDSISVIQALTMAGGLTANAKPNTAWILRPVANTSRRAEISLDLDKILAGKDADRPLLPNDVLYVPKKSVTKQNLGKALTIGLPVAATITAIVIGVTR
jgi:polysaccharide biosynthesis/export protein